jgi:hypothetical protein
MHLLLISIHYIQGVEPVCAAEDGCFELAERFHSKQLIISTDTIFNTGTDPTKQKS